MLTVKDKKFYLNGEEFKIHSGSLHYFRALPEYWESLLTKIKAAGFNCVETYTCWNLHEPKKGVYNFEGMLDLEKFIETADKVGLKVILRTGPFICAEWENGGLPAWLLKDPGIRLRCNSEPYITHLHDWFRVLLAKIKPYLDTNGGPVIAMAVENEYGSFGDDFSYLAKVKEIYIEAGIDCLLFASDGSGEFYFCTGRADMDMIQATDFGVGNAKNEIVKIDQFDNRMPYFCVEYWAGNFSSWCEPECYKDSIEKTKQDINDMVDLGASFNVYMIYGGTNFGFTGGANTTGPTPIRYFTTSYDYDAAITEWGGYTQRYFDMKEALERDAGKPADVPVPPSPTFQKIGEVALTESGAFFENQHIGKKHHSATVECMEHFDQNYGYILYRKVMDYTCPVNYVHMIDMRDRAYVFLNGEFMGMRQRGEDETAVLLPRTLVKGDVIEILVENMGRICFSRPTYLGDRKGILGGVFLSSHPTAGGKCAFNWEVTCFEMDKIDNVKYNEGTEVKCPAFFKGTFKAENQDSCFVHFENFTKGYIFVNGFNLGRYWDRGPQTALYLPGALLKEENEIVVFEAEGLKGAPVLALNGKHGLGDHNPEVIVK